MFKHWQKAWGGIVAVPVMVASGTRIGIGPSLFSLGCLWFVGWHPHCSAEQCYNILRISWSRNVSPFCDSTKRIFLCVSAFVLKDETGQSCMFHHWLALSAFLRAYFPQFFAFPLCHLFYFCFVVGNILEFQNREIIWFLVWFPSLF